MICITVTPTSRTLAKADLLNAARQGDIVELCLDHFRKEPDVKELISAIDKPVIISCRRQQDGGQWQGTEEERLMLLRQAIVDGVEYVDLEMDIAERIPRYGPTKRIISYHTFRVTPDNLEELHERMCSLDADVVKLATMANHPSKMSNGAIESYFIIFKWFV